MPDTFGQSPALPPVAPTPSPAGELSVGQGPQQVAVRILMDPTLSPFEKAERFTRLKSDFLARTYNITGD